MSKTDSVTVKPHSFLNHFQKKFYSSMAAERERVSRKRKHKVDRETHRKLDVNQKVEVSSVEDGFLGSWHLGTVISCGYLIREVEYDYIVSEKGSGKLVELVKVSPIVDGLVPADEQPVHQCGMIRPSPPPYEFGRLPYGQCVDCFYQDAWWEGVMFDSEENDEERKVFFPELGDEMKAKVDKLRISQDWNEVTEEWKPRGSWIFLEVIEEIEKLNPLLISVKQIWYEVQLKDDFDEHLKKWTSCSKDIWRKLVKEVVYDNTKLTIQHFLSEVNSSQNFGAGGQLLEFSELAFEAELNLETYFDNSIAPSTEAACTLDSEATQPVAEDVSNPQPVDEQFVSAELAPTTEVVPPSEDVAGILSSARSEPPALENLKPRRGRPPIKKKFKGKNRVGEPDSCREANSTKTIKEKKLEDVSHLQPVEKQIGSEDVPLSVDEDCRSFPPSQKEDPSIPPSDLYVLLPPIDDIGGTLSSTKSQPPTIVKSKPRRGRPPTKKKKFEEQNRVGEPDSCREANSTKTIEKKKFEDASQPMDQDASQPMDQDFSSLQLPEDQDVSDLPPVEMQIVLENFAPAMEEVQLIGNLDDCRPILPSIAGILPSNKSQPLTIVNSKPCRGRPPTKKKKLEGQTVVGEPDSCPEATSAKTSKKPPSDDDTAGILSSTNSKSQTLENSKPRRGRRPTKKKQFEEQTLVSEPDSSPEATLIKEFEKMPSDEVAGLLSNNRSEQPTTVNSKSCRRRFPTKKKKFDWQSLCGEPDSCLEVIKKCMPSMSSIKKFKKHLLLTHWKFELKMESGKIKKSYIAPDGTVCASLSEVCQLLEEAKIAKQSSFHGDTDNSTQSPCMERPLCSEVPELPEKTSIEPEETRTEIEGTRIETEETITETEETRIETDETRIVTEETSIEPEETRIETEETITEAEETRIEPEETRIEPEICRQAVIDYCLPKSQDISAYQKSYRHGMRIGATSLKAKKYLAATGWKFYPVGKNDKRFRYCSPEGKTFVSFRKACKWCVKQWEAESHLPEQMSSPSTAKKNSCERSPVDTPLISLLRESRKKRKHADAKSRPSLKKGDGDMRSSKRARKVASTSTNQTPRTVLSWLIDNNVVLPRAKVKYCEEKNGNPTAEGRITREGIKCNCCQKIFGLHGFEAHAGSSCNRPSANIYLEDGRSLLECQMEMKHKHSIENKEGSHFTENDYICSVCHYGGDLILCDGCPSSFHLDCLGIKEAPDGDWFCPSCCCKVCGESSFVKNRKQCTDNTVLICCQCNHKYHAQCMINNGLEILDDFPEGIWFCTKRCELICLGMQHLLKKSVVVGSDNLTWTLLKYTEPHDDDESSVEIYTRLCVALNVMHESFEPVKERLTGRDIAEDVIFSRWSELNRLNFQGFYSILLERNDELISVATVRVYGEKVAEMPLVATQFQHRRLGMCRILMNELEKKLVELGVERLVLPAVPGVLNTWTSSFGFSVVEQSERANFLDYTFLDFQGTIMCQKILKKAPAKVQQAHVDNTNSKDNVELDDNIPLSELFQAKQVEGCATVDQGYVGLTNKLSS